MRLTNKLYNGLASWCIRSIAPHKVTWKPYTAHYDTRYSL